MALLAVGAAAIVADQLTKQVIGRTLDVGDSVDIVGPFSIHHVENSGIAFGLFSSRTTVVIAVTALAVGWMVWFFARSGRRHPVLPVALGLVLGGSVANLIDRVRLGRVTDFLDLEAWPAFNLADTFIVVGVAVLFGALVLADRPRRPHGPRNGDAQLQRR
ncbi:MAG: signal peptidase II [Actinobacteria bacterium RBG_16_68_12]|nr:MAG: signal peptidase II [Actinobacteria bacterium RBG_16_68_12]